MKTIRIGKANATFQQLVAIKENRNKRIQRIMPFDTSEIKKEANNYMLGSFSL